MTDHFDPGANVVRLSDPVATKPSVASMAVTAHELGHVQQYQTGSGAHQDARLSAAGAAVQPDHLLHRHPAWACGST